MELKNIILLTAFIIFLIEYVLKRHKFFFFIITSFILLFFVYFFIINIIRKGSINIYEFGRILKVLAARNSGPTEASLLWDWNNGQFRELSGDDL